MENDIPLSGFIVSFFWAIILLWVLAYCLALIIGYAVRYSSEWYFRKSYIRPVEFVPPDHLSAPECGWLYDRKLREAELYAAIVSLYQRGRVKLLVDYGKIYVGYIPGTSGKVDGIDARILGKLQLLKHGMGLDAFVAKLKLENTNILEEELTRDLVGKELFTQKEIKSFKMYNQRISIIIGMIMSGLTGLFLYLMVQNQTPQRFGENAFSDIDKFLSYFFALLAFFILIFINYILATGALRVYTNTIRRPTKLTFEHRELWRYVRAYYIYLKNVEADNLQGDLPHSLRNEHMPFAIALGLVQLSE